jgi:hypothetical protein
MIPQFPKFKRNHPGGDQYDITKFSAAKKAQHKFGNMGSDMDSDMGSDDVEFF